MTIEKNFDFGGDWGAHDQEDVLAFVVDVKGATLIPGGIFFGDEPGSVETNLVLVKLTAGVCDLLVFLETWSDVFSGNSPVTKIGFGRLGKISGSRVAYK